MKTLLPITKLLLLLALSISFLHCTEEPADVSEEIKAANVEFIGAFNEGDAPGMASHYTADATIYPSNMDKIQGREAIAGFWQGAMDSGLTKAELETTAATAYGDVALETGNYKLFVGDQMVDRGKYMVLWKKEDGQWKLHEDMWNTSIPAPAPAEEPLATDGAADSEGSQE